MFDIAWTELLVIAVVTIIVVGPKELPRLLRTIGQYTSKIRAMATDFKAQLDDAVKDTGIDTIKSDLESIKNANPVGDLRNALNPMSEDFEEDFKRLADEEDFDDPAAEDDSADVWELESAQKNKDAGKTADKPGTDPAAVSGTRIVEPAPAGETAPSSAPSKAAEKTTQAAAEREATPVPQAASPEPAPAAHTKAANGAHPPGIDASTAGIPPLAEKS